jgi:hypothetical protein
VQITGRDLVDARSGVVVARAPLPGLQIYDVLPDRTVLVQTKCRRCWPPFRSGEATSSWSMRWFTQTDPYATRDVSPAGAYETRTVRITPTANSQPRLVVTSLDGTVIGELTPPANTRFGLSFFASATWLAEGVVVVCECSDTVRPLLRSLFSAPRPLALATCPVAVR